MPVPPDDLARVHPVIAGEATVRELFEMLWSFSHGRRRILIVLIPLVLVLFALTSAVPLIVGEGLQRAAQRTDVTPILVVLVAAVVAIAVIRLVSTRLAVSTMAETAQTMQRAVFVQIHRTALVDSGAITRPSMVSRCSSYVDTVEAAVRIGLVNGLPALTNLILSLALLTWIAPVIGVAMIAVVIVLEAIRRWRSPVWSRRSRQRLDHSTLLSSHLDSVITHSESQRLTGGVGLVSHRFAVLADRLTRSRLDVELTGERLAATSVAVGQLGIVMVIAVAGVAPGALDVAQATAAVLYMGRVADSLAQLPTIVARLQDAAPAARRLRRILMAPALRDEPADPLDVDAQAVIAAAEESGRPMVTMRNVHAAIPGRSVALRRFSLEAQPGTWTTLASPTTGGSSIVINLLAGQLAPHSGTVTIADIDVAHWPATLFGQLVAAVPGDPVEFPGTVRENLRSDADDDTVLDVLGRCGLTNRRLLIPDGLETEVGVRSHPLPREARVAIALARAALQPGAVVVIEDPTSNLDTDAAVEVWAMMRRVFAGRTVIAATNRLELIGERDQVIVMRNGSAIERGRRSQLVAAGGTFARWWGRSRAGGGTRLGTIAGLEELDDDALDSLAGRLITERYDADEVVVSAGDPAERIYIVADGEVELLGPDGHRLALCRPGDYFGDLDPDTASIVGATARTLEPTVLTSLHRFAISSGVAGVVDRSPEQRALYRWLARRGPSTRPQLEADDGPGAAALRELEALVRDRVVVMEQSDVERYRVSGSQRRRRSSSLLSSMFDEV